MKTPEHEEDHIMSSVSGKTPGRNGIVQENPSSRNPNNPNPTNTNNSNNPAMNNTFRKGTIQ
jgi:hypothetical protein